MSSTIVTRMHFNKYYTKEEISKLEVGSKEYKYYLRSCWARCRGKNNIVDYSNREEAVDVLSESSELKKDDLTKVYCDGDNIPSVIGYMSHRHGSEGLFSLEHNNFTKDEMKSIKKKLSKTKNVVFDGVISLDAMHRNLFSSIDEVRNIIKEPFKDLLEANDRSIDDYDIYIAVHNNTAHKHLHYTMVYKYDEVVDTEDNSKFNKKSFDRFRKNQSKNVRQYDTNMAFDLRSLLKNLYKEEISSDEFARRIEILSNELGDLHDVKQFARLEKQQQESIKKFNESMKDYFGFRKLYSEFLGELDSRVKDFKDNIKEFDGNIKEADHFKNNVLDGFESFMNNSLLKCVIKTRKHYALRKNLIRRKRNASIDYDSYKNIATERSMNKARLKSEDIAFKKSLKEEESLYIYSPLKNAFYNKYMELENEFRSAISSLIEYFNANKDSMSEAERNELIDRVNNEQSRRIEEEDEMEMEM